MMSVRRLIRETSIAADTCSREFAADKSGQQKDWAPDPSDYAIHKQRKDITDLVPIVPASSGEKRASRGGASGPAAKVAKK